MGENRGWRNVGSLGVLFSEYLTLRTAIMRSVCRSGETGNERGFDLYDSSLSLLPHLFGSLLLAAFAENPNFRLSSKVSRREMLPRV